MRDGVVRVIVIYGYLGLYVFVRAGIIRVIRAIRVNRVVRVIRVIIVIRVFRVIRVIRVFRMIRVFFTQAGARRVICEDWGL